MNPEEITKARETHHRDQFHAREVAALRLLVLNAKDRATRKQLEREVERLEMEGLS